MNLMPGVCSKWSCAHQARHMNEFRIMNPKYLQCRSNDTKILRMVITLSALSFTAEGCQPRPYLTCSGPICFSSQVNIKSQVDSPEVDSLLIEWDDENFGVMIANEQFPISGPSMEIEIPIDKSSKLYIINGVGYVQSHIKGESEKHIQIVGPCDTKIKCKAASFAETITQLKYS